MYSTFIVSSVLRYVIMMVFPLLSSPEEEKEKEENSRSKKNFL
jgi:hypothetical protein